MQVHKHYLTRLNRENVWIIVAFFLLISPAHYGFASCRTADLPRPYQHKNDSSQNDTLSKVGLIFQVKGQNIFVADKDFPTRLDWKEAQNLCSHIGNGWRLPSNDELDAMYTQLHLQGRGNFYGLGYWSNQEIDSSNASVMYFLSGEKHPTRKLMPIKVRPVRTP